MTGLECLPVIPRIRDGFESRPYKETRVQESLSEEKRKKGPVVQLG